MRTFTIPGRPEQQGSKRLIGKHMIEANGRLADWRATAVQAMHDPDADPYAGPVKVAATFIYARPGSHYGTGRNSDTLKPSAPVFKDSAPDLDKLQRAVGDALEAAGIIVNDSRIVAWDTSKIYGPMAATSITVEEVAR